MSEEREETFQAGGSPPTTFAKSRPKKALKPAIAGEPSKPKLGKVKIDDDFEREIADLIAPEPGEDHAPPKKVKIDEVTLEGDSEVVDLTGLTNDSSPHVVASQKERAKGTRRGLFGPDTAKKKDIF
jgi:hypothetical protein